MIDGSKPKFLPILYGNFYYLLYSMDVMLGAGGNFFAYRIF